MEVRERSLSQKRAATGTMMPPVSPESRALPPKVPLRKGTSLTPPRALSKTVSDRLRSPPTPNSPELKFERREGSSTRSLPIFGNDPPGIISPASSRSMCSSLPSPVVNEKQETNIKVALRVRPFTALDRRSKIDDVPALGVTGSATVSVRNLQFTFDHLLWSAGTPPSSEIETEDSSDEEFCPRNASQTDVYKRIGSPVVDTTLAGFNSCVFAYGQTGSGKTYTMMGDSTPEGKGLLPRITEELFHRSSLFSSKKATFEVSFMEIYCEKVKDLLKASEYASLRVRQHPVKGVFVEGIERVSVSSWDECEEVINRGNQQRVTASTSMNEKSSRSHAVFIINVTIDENVKLSKNGRITSSQRTAVINLVDLAGSERVSRTGCTGQLLEEATQINLSLTVLRKVIDGLVEKSRGARAIVPVRESMLTWVLSDSLGGNSKTTMIATASPTSESVEETICTLRYAVKARSIVNVAKVNEDSHARIVRDLQLEISKLRSEQDERTSDTEVLAAQIELNERALKQVRDAAKQMQQLHKQTISQERDRRLLAEAEATQLSTKLQSVELLLAEKESFILSLQQQNGTGNYESGCSLCGLQ
eukprot:TRINITY_DN5324_c1_g1_i1.p1 TRINITY_DN5324_c1_g1~~TRINITY_DN5324_c1_g1_i1.p1  ORF type:complete len:592 (+),score=90.26 TRINITY_DN5324_c1_g1_i1:1646-3421(+)